MSRSHSHAAASSPSPNFELIFNNALKEYERRTKKDLLAHPLAAQLQTCDSPGAVLLVLRQQVQGLSQSRKPDEALTKWLDPAVNVLYSLSGTLGEGIGLVFSPAKVIFAGVGVLLLAAKDVCASQASLVDVFETMENFFHRLEVYTGVSPTVKMMEIIMKIMTEVLTILAIVTKDIKTGRTKLFLKKLIGISDVEAALKRLDKLTHEEARMATAQILKATRTVDDRVGAVNEQVAGVHDRVASVGERVKVIGERVKVVNDKVAEVIDEGKEVKLVMRQTANDVDQVKQNQSRENLRKWLSPPDPSTNHNAVCAAHHEGSAKWFLQGNMFNDWKSTGTLLWIHGKPGSGKSVLCSTIIRDIEAICKTGQGAIGYFYFDFRDTSKQHWHSLLHSLLTQLSSRSGPRCDILSHLYSDHDSGAQRPSDDTLVQCLKEMLTVPDQRPIYLIIDGVDECPNTTGIPSPRERVLQFVKQLIDLRLPYLHVCVASRPEIDIRDILEPLTSYRVSLHDQAGQKKDIEDYVRSVVYSDSEPIMKRWRKEDKDLVIETLSEKADGMFRWAFCQLDLLRHCLPPSVRRTLQQLPESLDETYERVLKEIKKPNRDHARRFLQCLVVAIRPLRVEELAELIAFDFDDAEGLPKLDASWRWGDQEQALLSSCSSLIAIADAEDSRVVQFSHFSVKQYLMSSRLAASKGDVSCYHVDMEPAHTILAQACLSILLKLDDRVEKNSSQQSLPLARYAAEHWTSHAQFKDVSTRIHKGMECLFDPNKPHFSAWLRFHNIDTYLHPPMSIFFQFTPSSPSKGGPLYYASLCGFHDLAKCLITKYPEQVNTRGGCYVIPLLAALSREHFQTAELLYHSGADPNVLGHYQKTPLHSAAFYGNLQMVKALIKYNADINAQDHGDRTPLHEASSFCTPNGSNIVRVLLDHGAGANARRQGGSTPLHDAAREGLLEVARALLEHGADVQAEDNQGKTPFQVVSAATYSRDRDEIMKLLLRDQGAK